MERIKEREYRPFRAIKVLELSARIEKRKALVVPEKEPEAEEEEQFVFKTTVRVGNICIGDACASLI